MLKDFLLPNNLKPLDTSHVLARHIVLLILGVAYIVIFCLEYRLGFSWLGSLYEGKDFVVTTFGIHWLATPETLIYFGSENAGNSAYLGFYYTMYWATILVFEAIFLTMMAALWWKRPIWEGLNAGLKKTVWVYIIFIVAIFILCDKLCIVTGFYKDPPDPWQILPLGATAIIFTARGFTGPVVEELIFRFGIFRFLRRRFSFILAALISSLLFGLAHAGYPDPLKIALTALGGIFGAWSYEKTGSLMTPIGIHMLTNILHFLING